MEDATVLRFRGLHHIHDLEIGPRDRTNLEGDILRTLELLNVAQALGFSLDEIGRLLRQNALPCFV